MNKYHMILWVEVLLNHSAKFDKNRSCESRDTTFLFCYMTSQGNMIKETCGLVSGSQSTSATILPRFDAYRSCRIANETFLFSQLPLFDQVIKGYITFCVGAPYLKVWEPLTLSPHCAKFDDYRPCGNGDVTFLFCLVTSRDHMIKGTCDFLNGSSSTKVATVPSLMLAGLIEVKM